MAQKIMFTVSAEIAENATSGILLGDFNNWDFEQGIALKQQKDGSLTTTISLESGTYQYRYFLSDGRWVNDGNADAYVYSEEFFVDNCLINVPEKTTKTKKVAVEPVIEVTAPAPKKTATKKATTKPVEPVVAAPVVIEKKVTKAKKDTPAPVEEVAAPAKKAAAKTAKAKK